MAERVDFAAAGATVLVCVGQLVWITLEGTFLVYYSVSLLLVNYYKSF